MSFILKEPFTFINIKLTDTGRRMMASGAFKMTKAVLLDREIDYDVDNSGYFNMFDSRIISPPDYYPDTNPFNLDGSTAYMLSNQRVTSQKLIVTAQTDYSGFFTGSLNSWTLDTSLLLGTNHITYATNAAKMAGGSNLIEFDNPIGYYWPRVGDLVFIPWVHDTTIDYMTSSQAVPPTQPVLCNWYEVIPNDETNGIIAKPTLTLDRPINGSASAAECTCFFYANNAIETRYGSGATQNTPVWNMNIVRTQNIIGTNTAVSGHTNYVNYGSIEYNGTRKYFGFGTETPAVGFVHYTNEYTGNTYAEQLVEKSFEMYLPMIMWHHSSGQMNGSGSTWGAAFYDTDGPTHYDAVAKTSFRELKDSRDYSGITVGRVYHKLKLVVITDQELLIALSYKSNRNYTLPDFYTRTTVKPPTFSLTGTTGLCMSGYDYFVTYVPASSAYTNSVTNGLSFGHKGTVPCGHIKKIVGNTDENGNPTYLELGFSNPDSFPFMRSPATWNAYAGIGGWNANTVQVLVNEQPSYLNYDIANVPSDGWRRMSNITSKSGNGIYWCTANGDSTINPSKLNAHQFIMSREDYVSGSTYNLPGEITFYMDYLNFGDESVFHGVIRTAIQSTGYKSTISVLAKNQELNSSKNPSYNGELHEEIFVTEVVILDDKNQVVAAGKPTYPIKKLAGKYLGFKLEIDF